MIKKFLSMSAFVLAFLLVQSPVAMAGHCGCEMGKKMHEMMAKLDLNKEQQDKIKGIMDKHKEGMKVKHDELHDVRMLANTAFNEDKMTESKVDEFVNKETQIVGEMMKCRMMERFEVSQVLTPEQKKKLHAMMDKWKADHKDKKCDHKPGPGPHDGPGL
ncbi:MAG: Spy/CpxP family protein refolding chaperone [Legionellaceae bacterium]|nr:Spy/CpxP family protein refolding chaperone [Legionellaceae bacterium]